MSSVSGAAVLVSAPEARPRRLFRFYARLNRIDDWFERRFTVAGRVVLWSAVGAALFSLDTRRSFAYQMFALALALLVVAVLWTVARRRAPFDVRRHLPPLATVGEPLTYRLELRANAQVRDVQLWLRERLSGALPDAAAFATLREPGAARRSWFDRKLGFPRWIWLARRARGARTDGIEVVLDAGGSTSTRVSMTPLRRGYIEFAAVDLGRTDPCGLCRQIDTRALPGRVLALPRRFPVAPAVMPGRGDQFSVGGGLSQKQGYSTEFLGVREFKPGDALKHMHWKRFASLGEPIVREFQAQATRRLAVVLDTAGAISGAPVFEEAVSVAASVIEAAGVEHGVVDLVLPDAAVAPPVDDNAGTEALLAALATVDGSGEASLDALADDVLAQQGVIAGVVLVLLGFDDRRRAFVELLSGAGLQVAVIAVLPAHAVLPPPAPDVRFVNAGKASVQLLE